MGSVCFLCFKQYGLPCWSAHSSLAEVLHDWSVQNTKCYLRKLSFHGTELPELNAQPRVPSSACCWSILWPAAPVMPHMAPHAVLASADQGSPLCSDSHSPGPLDIKLLSDTPHTGILYQCDFFCIYKFLPDRVFVPVADRTCEWTTEFLSMGSSDPQTC